MANIDIETEALKNMTNAVNAALGELANADSILRAVTEHNDWGCKERGQINQHIQQARSDMSRLKDYGSQFHSNVAKVLHDFLETEKGIGNLFSGLESAIGDMLDIWGQTDSSIGPIETPDYLAEQGIYIKNKPITPIKIADFQTLLSGMEE